MEDLLTAIAVSTHHTNPYQLPPPTHNLSPSPFSPNTASGGASFNSPFGQIWSPSNTTPGTGSGEMNWGATAAGGGGGRKHATAPASGSGGGGGGRGSSKRQRKSASASIKIDDGSDLASDGSDDDPASDENDRGGKGGAAGGGGEGEVKKKSTRGSRACGVCRRLKMRCQESLTDPEGKCKRCRNGGHECIFEESQRGRRSNRKSDAMAKSLKKMEETLDTVLRSLGPNGAGSIAAGAGAGMISEPGMIQRSNSGLGGSVNGAGSGYSPSHLVDLVGAANNAANQQALSLGVGVGGINVSSALPSSATNFVSTPGAHQTVSNLYEHGSASGVDASVGGLLGRERQAWQNGLREGRHAGLGGLGAPGGQRRDTESPRLHSLPDNTLNPLGLLAEASLQNTRKRAVTLSEVLDSSRGDVDLEDPDEDDKHGGGVGGSGAAGGSGLGQRKVERAKLGLANGNYFQPGPMNILPLRRIVIEHRMPPALLIEKIVTIEEVVELFNLFFEHCHRSCPVLDPDVHTPTATGSRSPFLFTCICSVAARYYTKRTDDLYRKCLRVAKRVAFDVMTKGFKSTEICQGFLLLCQWNQPAERFEEERTYQFSGIATRMATDLNLHRKTLAILPDEVSEETRNLYEREIMNRERTWMYAFISDRSVSTQMGKPYSISKEDFIVRNAKSWYRQPGGQKSDVGLSAMVEIHRIVSRIIDTLYSDTRSVSGLNNHLDYPTLMRAALAQLSQWREDWTIAFPADPEDASDGPRAQMRDFYHSYYRLFLLSFAVQHALDNPESAIDLATYCVLCFESASTIITIARDSLGPSGILRYGIDSTYVYLSYAATFLLKLINPVFSNLVDATLVMKLVQDAADTLERAAVDDTHTPALYASFLRALIENKRTGGRTMPNSRSNTRPSSPAANYSSGSTVTGMESYIRSRQPSVAPENALPGVGEELGEDANFTSFDSLAMDTMLQEGGFWDNMLMPGSLYLSGGTGNLMGSTLADPWSFTPVNSRPASPSQMNSTFDFTNPGSV